MAEGHGKLTKRVKAALAVFLLALVLRILGVCILGSDTNPAAYEHGMIAQNMREGKGFAISVAVVDAEPQATSQQSPLYPPLLAGLWWVCGTLARAILALLLIQAVLGALTAVFIMQITRVLLGERFALAGGLLAALYPAYAYAPTHVQVVVLLTFFQSGGIWLLTEEAFGEDKTWRWLAGYALMGFAVLTDPIAVVLCPWPALFYAWKRLRRAAPGQRPWRRVAVRLALGVAAAWLVLLPWTIRNAVMHRGFVFVKGTFWYSFWQGNNPASRGTDKLPPDDPAFDKAEFSIWNPRAANREMLKWHGAAKPVDDTLPHEQRDALRTLSEPERCKRFKRWALDYLRNDFPGYLRLCALRFSYFFWADPTNPKARHPLYRAGNVALEVLALLGFLLAFANGRRAESLFALACILSILAFHTLTIFAVRFRLPAEIFMLALAARSVRPKQARPPYSH